MEILKIVRIGHVFAFMKLSVFLCGSVSPCFQKGTTETQGHRVDTEEPIFLLFAF